LNYLNNNVMKNIRTIKLDKLLIVKRYRKMSIEELRQIINGSDGNRVGVMIDFEGYVNLSGKYSIDKATILYNKWHNK
jgi:hypothetical protein